MCQKRAFYILKPEILRRFNVWKKNNGTIIHLPLFFVTLTSFIIIIGVIIGVTVFLHNTQQQTNGGTQVKDHIGYFDEDVQSTTSNIDIDNPSDVGSSKTNNKKNISKQQEKTKEAFLKASLSKNKKQKNNKSKSKIKVQLTKAQKLVKKHSELNNGEWLPPIKD